MSIQPQFESHRYIGEVCKVKGQSIVECRLSGSEISGVLAVQVKAIPTESVCLDGEVQYGGKALLCIVYEDGEKKVCRAERGIEFSHKVEGGLITPACFAKVFYTAENTTVRREGSGLYISVIVGADISVYGGKQMEYLSGGEGLICQKESLSVCKTVCVSGETEGEDEFDADYVGDVLLHGQTALVNRVSAHAGQLDIEGEIALHICVLKGDDGLCSYERVLPFRMQVPCDEAFGDITATARVLVKSAHLTATTDEEKGKCRMLFAYTLSADCFLYIKEALSACVDAYSTRREIHLKRANEGGKYLTKQLRLSERINGFASLSPSVEGEVALQASVLPRAELTCRKGENGWEVEGAILAEVLFLAPDGGHRTTTLSLPFLFPIDGEGDFVEGDALVCGLNLRRKKSGEIEADATLKGSLRCYQQTAWSYITDATSGEEYEKENAAFSVFLTGAGEALWEVAKRLKCSPEELQKSNPDLEFPLKTGGQIYIYRQIE